MSIHPFFNRRFFLSRNPWQKILEVTNSQRIHYLTPKENTAMRVTNARAKALQHLSHIEDEVLLFNGISFLGHCTQFHTKSIFTVLWNGNWNKVTVPKEEKLMEQWRAIQGSSRQAVNGCKHQCSEGCEECPAMANAIKELDNRENYAV